MADDYKHIATPVQKQKQFPWLPVILMLLLLATGAGTALWVAKTTQKTENTVQAPEPEPETTTDEQQATEETKKEQEEEEPTEEQQFDFYTVLPQMEVPIIDARPPGQKEPEQPKDKPSELPEITASGNSYFLQIGSFQDEQAAMELRDRINTMKLKSSIQKVRLMNSGVWYRVNVGPFARLAASDKARQVLDNHGIRYTLMKQISRNQDEH